MCISAFGQAGQLPQHALAVRFVLVVLTLIGVFLVHHTDHSMEIVWPVLWGAEGKEKDKCVAVRRPMEEPTIKAAGL